ncbi:MAG TPA: signal peptidase II [Candidatus Blautia avistercoris]|nr:signal peptidase II [Candidatus Blautia avistercoris]
MVQAAVLAAVFGLDTAVKNFINNHKLQGSETRILKEKVFIRNLHNPDGIFGIMKGHKEASRKLSLLILGGVLWEFFRNFFKKGSRMTQWGLALVLGGGLCNYWERETKGYVTDYLSVNAGPEKFRKMVFNLSDVCILAGALLYAAGQMKRKK